MTKMMLTARELADLRADILETLPDTCTILRSVLTTDAYGDTVPVVGTAASGVACRLDPFNRQDSSGLVAGREDSRTYYVLTLEWNANIDDGDQVVVNGESLEVMQLFDIHSNRATKRAYVAAAASV